MIREICQAFLVVVVTVHVAEGGGYTPYNDVYGPDYSDNNNYGDYNGYDYGIDNGYGDYNGYGSGYDDYDYNSYGDNSYGYVGYSNDKNEYYSKYHGMKLVGNRFNYGGKDYRLSCGLNRFYGYWNRCYGKLHSTRGCVGQLLKEHRFDIYRNDYDYNNYGDNSYGYVGYSNDKNEYYSKYHGMKLVGNRFNYGGKDYRLSCGLNRFYGYWNRCYGKLHSTRGCVGQLLKEHRFDIYRNDYDFNNYGDNSYGYVGYSNDKNEYYSKYHGMKLVGNRFNYGGKDYRLSCGLNRFYGYWNRCYGILHSTKGCFGQLLKEHRFDIYRTKNYLYKQLKLHKKIANNHVKKVNYIAKAHVAAINKVAKGHTNAIKYTTKKHVGIIATVANKHINKIKSIVQTHLYKLQKHTKKHLYAVEVQHKRHMASRSYQNKVHLANKEILHQKHKIYIYKKLSKYNKNKYMPGSKGKGYDYHYSYKLK